MALTIEITDVTVKDAGEKFQGKMHNVSAKLVLKDGETVVLERSFSEKHKDIYSMTDTMEKIRLKMDAAKKIYEAEQTLKAAAEAETLIMISKLEGK